MRVKSILAALLLTVAGVKTMWAQKVVLHPTGKEAVEYEVSELDSIVFVDAEPLLTCPDENHPHAIDLGLPSGTKWCCSNVGASTPEGYGGYYAWGETTTKNEYNTGTYAHYNANTGYIHIGYNIAGTDYDAATVNMGAKWRMPSRTQLQELIDNCSSEWTQQNGVNGRLMVGPSGGQIFLPAAGTRWGGNLSNADNIGYYWSCTRDSDSGKHAWCLRVDSGRLYWGNSTMRADGNSVRSVCQ